MTAGRTAFLVMLAGGVAGGIVLGLPTAVVGRMLGQSAPTGWGDLVGVLLGALLGYPVGVTVGAALASRRLHGSGSPWLALLGSAVGVGLVLVLAEPLRLNQSPLLLAGLFLLLPPVLAALALLWWGRFARRARCLRTG